MENKKLFMDGMGIKSMLWMGAMGIAFVNADAVDNLTGKAVWQQENISCEEDARYVGYDYCSKYGYTYYTGNCDQKSSGFVNEGVGYKSYKMCAYLQAVKLANYALKGETGEDEVKILKEKCVPKTTEKNGYDYQDYNCESNWYGYMEKDTFDEPCGDQLGMKVGGEDDYGRWSYDLCSFQPGTYAKTYYGIGAVAQSEKMVKQARDAEQQVTDDKAKNKEEAKEVKEAKEGRLKVRECPDVKKGDTKDKFFCFEELAGDRFFDKTVSEWGDSLTKQVKIEIDGELKEVAIEVEVWPTCEGVNTPCGQTTDKNTEYFTRDGKYFLVREEKGEKKTADDKGHDDSEGDDSEGNATEGMRDYYVKNAELDFELDILDRIADCEGSDSGICKLVKDPNYKAVLQKIAKEVAENDANEKVKELYEERKQIAAEQAREEKKKIEEIKSETARIKKEIEEREELAKLQQEVKKYEEDEKELTNKRLINLEEIGADGMTY